MKGFKKRFRRGRVPVERKKVFCDTHGKSRWTMTCNHLVDEEGLEKGVVKLKVKRVFIGSDEDMLAMSPIWCENCESARDPEGDPQWTDALDRFHLTCIECANEILMKAEQVEDIDKKDGAGHD